MAVPEHAVHYLEIVTPDVEGLRALYAEAYGYEFEPAAPELGNAVVASLPNGGALGIRAPMSPEEQPIVRPYVRVTDLEAAVASAEGLGAEIALGPTEIPGRGRIAIYLFGGNHHGMWQTD